MRRANARHGLSLRSFTDLHSWSVGVHDDATRLDFWQLVWEEIALIHEGAYARVVDLAARMDSVPRWFEGVRLNFAENVLFFAGADGPGSRTAAGGKEDGKIAATEVREGGSEIRHVSWGKLRARVGLFENAMKARGVRRGDRVAVVASNSLDTLCVFLAVTAIGGIFSSSSTDMGTKGVLDRLTQIKPVWVFIDDWAVYNGKTVDLRPKVRDIVNGMKDVKEFKGVVSQPRWQNRPEDMSDVPSTITLAKFLEAANGKKDLTFERVEYRDPFLVVYSSGTTGIPKCIVHSVGGLLTSALKEQKLHRDYGPDTVTLQYTTTGWIMYLSTVLSLLSGARTILYDGSPFQPDLKAFVRLVSEQKVTDLGISPRWMHEYQKNDLSPREIADLSSLRAVTSTGMVLKDQLFEWFYDTGFPSHVLLANMSGGTDLAACFGMENPLTPLYVGGCQGPSLGTPVVVYDQLIEGGVGVKGKQVEDGIPGELVAYVFQSKFSRSELTKHRNKAFPNMPVFFWGSDGAQKYFNAYFARFDNVWTHGDFIMVHPITKQIFFLGRADGVLNPSGVRFGSAEIYSVIETFFPQVQDSLCVGQRRPQDHDESVMLFLLMAPGQKFTKALVEDVKQVIARELSKRHVPKYVFETPEIPTTINLKKVELPVKRIVSGHILKPSDTLANKDCLNFYYQFAKVGLEGEDVKSKL